MSEKVNNQKKRTRKKITTGSRIPALPDEKKPRKGPSTVKPPVLPATSPLQAVTADGVVQCRFELFVVLRTGVISRFKDQQRAWCFRGDKFTDYEPKMLKNLLNHAKKEGHKYYRMEFYDNLRPKTDGQRLILKFENAQIRVNRLDQYSDILSNYPLTDCLQQITNTCV